jgi:hypothetical protein
MNFSAEVLYTRRVGKAHSLAQLLMGILSAFIGLGVASSVMDIFNVFLRSGRLIDTLTLPRGQGCCQAPPQYRWVQWWVQ